MSYIRHIEVGWGIECDAMPNMASATSPRDDSPDAGPAFSPLYQQIKALIIRSLQAGEWRPGDAIPSELELAGRYKVSQGTVRKAIDELAGENRLVRRQGKGTYVATHAEQHTQFRFLRLVPDQPGASGAAGMSRRVLECRRMRPPADVAEALGLRSRDSVVNIRRTLSFQGRPVVLDEIWLPGNLFKGLTAERLNQWRGPDVRPVRGGVRRAHGARRGEDPRGAARCAAGRPAVGHCGDTAAQRGARGLHLQRRTDGTAARAVPDRYTPLPQRTVMKTAIRTSACCVAIEFSMT